MNVKVIVKVMNFHSLLRVDSARKKAEKYSKLEHEVSEMIDIIMNNKNFILDKKILKVDPKKPELNIYIGSDYGFCGNVNAQVNSLLQFDTEAERITIGRKIKHGVKNELLKVSREEFQQNYDMIGDAIKDSIEKMSHSRINVIYNHFNNSSNIELKKKCIFPFELHKKSKEQYNEDFAIEGNENELLKKLVILYINYEIKIAADNSYASENIMRQNATSESLKKIDEKNEKDLQNARKQKNQKEFQKIIDSYTKKMGLGAK